MNTLKSTLLLVVLTLFLILIGDYFGGQNGMVLAFLLSVVFNFGTYFFSDKIALAMYNAQPVTREELPRAYAAVAPIAAAWIQLAISGRREYEADATGAATTGNPYALARALQKLDAYSKRIPMEAWPSKAPLFIVAPLRGSGGIASLFSTHPPMKDRIRRLIGRDFV